LSKRLCSFFRREFGKKQILANKLAGRGIFPFSEEIYLAKENLSPGAKTLIATPNLA